MKKNNTFLKVTAGIAIALVSFSCTNDDVTSETPDNHKKAVSVVARIGDGDSQSDTRLTYEEGGIQPDGSASMVVKWEKEEKIAIFHISGGKWLDDYAWSMDFDIMNSNASDLSADRKSTVFKGEVTTGEDNMIYCAIYPVPQELKSINVSGETTLYYIVDMAQTQDCNNPTAHLKEHDILTCSGVYDFEDIDFMHGLTVLRFDLTLPEAKEIKEIALSTSWEFFITSMQIRLEGGNSGPYPYPIESADKITLPLLNAKADNKVKAYMMVMGKSFEKDTPLTVTATAVDGTVYKKDFKAGIEGTLRYGKCYSIVKTLEKQ